MYPYYSYKIGWTLDPDDIAGIQKLYGIDTGKPDKPMPPVTMPPNMKCTGKFDTIIRTKDGSTYAFIGTMVYKLDGGNIAPGFPAKIRDIFPGLPNDLDASVFLEDIGSTYIFKGDQYYRLTNTKMDTGYPRHISVWNGLPSDLDAAFVWSGNGRVYFIKGDEYYWFNRKTGRVEDGYPRPLTVWPGLPSRIDSAMQWSNKRTYFFSEEQYFRFNDYLFTVDSSYPRSTVQYWVGCDEKARLEASNNVHNSSVVRALPGLFPILCSAVLSLNRLFNNIL
ncbi:Matrix metalloproteinase-14 [Holothuria leucospilota]|uniref:Matrix metalloproteinase-14 n=1 Tax=Holothuria leucospilota TaxID=206669 RepID=A0A9Q0YJJ3_HOLLE|nr:Matrix metalloproteinase-14 [Holothuria leucospilota]